MEISSSSSSSSPQMELRERKPQRGKHGTDNSEDKQPKTSSTDTTMNSPSSTSSSFHLADPSTMPSSLNPPDERLPSPHSDTRPSLNNNNTRSPLKSFSNLTLPNLPTFADFPKMDLSQLPGVGSLSKMGGEMPSIEVNFAPLTVPPHRRLQTALVALWSLALPISFILFLILCSIPILWPIIGPYLIWVGWVDDAPRKGGRVSGRFRRWWGWRYFAGYYPVSIIKEADLPPDRPYVFGYHPHGIIGTGAFCNFATDATGFSTLFPGIRPHLLTLALNFHTPIYRDILLLLGVCSVSKRSCVNILRQGPGSAITIVVGGAAESLAAHPGTNDLTLKKRLGFIKIAVREGADLVPVFSFGENDIYEQLNNHKGTTVYKVQKRFQKMFGFTLPLFHGRGIFNYNLGLMPFRHPVVSVVGRPIHVTQNDNPSTEQLEVVQKEYIEELMRVWESYKDVYARNRTRELRVVE